MNVYEITLSSHLGTNLGVSPIAQNPVLFNLLQTISVPNRRFEMTTVGGVIPRSFHQVSTFNNTFDLVVDLVTYPILFPPGSYNVFQLRDQMKTQFDLATGQVWDISYDTSTNAFTFKVTDAYGAQISLVFDPLLFTHELLGFNIAPGPEFVFFDDLAGSWKLVSDMAVNVTSIPSVEIHLSDVTIVDSISPEGNISMIRKVFFSRGFNAIETISPLGLADWKTCSSDSRVLNQLTVHMKDSHGRTINFEGADWELSLYIRVPIPTEDMIKIGRLDVESALSEE